MAAKYFEVGDVLPQGIIRISWYDTALAYRLQLVFTDSNSFELINYSPYNYGGVINGINVYDDDGAGWLSPYTGYPGDHAYIDIDTSNWSLSKRTVSTVNNFSAPTSRYCKWEEVTPQGFSVTFEENDGSTVTDLTEQTELPTPLPTTTKANHVFAGWYYDNLFTQKANAGDELESNVTLYAKWYTPTTWCQDIADAIREKEGSSGNIKHVDFADRIRAL